MEEVGLEVTLGDIVATVDLIERDRDDRVRYHYTLIDFVAEAPSAALRPGSDAADARWFTWPKSNHWVCGPRLRVSGSRVSGAGDPRSIQARPGSFPASARAPAPPVG